MPPGGIKPRNSKRVFAEQATTRATRSSKNLTVQDGDANSGMPAPKRLTGNHTLSALEDDGPLHPDENTHMSNGSDGPAQADDQNQMGNDDGSGTAQPASDYLLANEEGNAITLPEQQTKIDNSSEEIEERWNRGTNMGKGLRKLSRARRGKLKVEIPEGKQRPVVPFVAAKFATECNIAVRNHVPMLPHWKDYKNQPGLFKLFLGKLSAKFDIDTSLSHIKHACYKMIKSAVRQQRYKLKKEYFDPHPLHLVRRTSPVKSMSDQQWKDLVETWKKPKNMATCQTNKANRAKVIFHQTTGSHSYEVHCENLGEEYNDVDPNAFDYFKVCHYSKKKEGYMPRVQAAITEMQTKLSEQLDSDQQPKSVTDVVADVLAEHTKKNIFLQNVGIRAEQSQYGVVNLEAQLVTERRTSAELPSVINSQREHIDALSEQVKEVEQARVRDKEDMQKMQTEMEKKQAATDSKIELLLSHIRST